MPIRNATLDDAFAMGSLILGESHLITLSPEGTGAESVLLSMTPEAVAANMASDRFRYWVMEAQGADGTPLLQGLVGVRDGTHLYHLFVRRDLHRQGIGRRLWQHVLTHWPSCWKRPPHITVNASPYGLSAYTAYGFEATGPHTEVTGIAFVPMRCHLP